MSQAHLFIVILAAGLSKRLGFPKQLISRHQQTLLEEKIALASLLSPQGIFVVVPDIDTNWAKVLQAQVSKTTAQMIFNNAPSTGMAHSIQLAVQAVSQAKVNKDARVIFLTIDQINLTYNDLLSLTQNIKPNELRVSRYKQDAKPRLGIPVNLTLAFLQTFAKDLQGDQGFRRLWQLDTAIKNPDSNMTYHIEPIDLPKLARDIDTPEQFEQLKIDYQLEKPNANEVY